MTQQLPLREQMRNLEHLQELDLKIDRLKKNKSSLPATLKALDDSLAKLKTTADTKKKAMDEVEKAKRQTQAALDLNRDRLARSTTRLDSVQNSQEFQAITKEIEQLKKQTTLLEEQAKKSTQEWEAMNQEVETLTGQMTKIQQERDAQAQVVSGQNTQFETEIKSLVGERAKYTNQVESRILTQYDRIRMARGGLGIVPAVGGRCKGCNMMVPPQLYNEVQKGTQVHICPSCNRILFVPSAAQSGENTGAGGDTPSDSSSS